MAEESSILGDILGGIGSVLGAPKNLLYSSVISPLMGRDVNSFKDILVGAGMDEDNWATGAAGFLGDVFTDPLTYLGGFGASALRNKMFGKTAGIGKAAGRGTGLKAPTVMRETAEKTPVLYSAEMSNAVLPPGVKNLGGGQRLVTSRAAPEGDVLMAQLKANSARVPASKVQYAADDLASSGFVRDQGSQAGFNYGQNPYIMIREAPLSGGAGLVDDAVNPLTKLRHERVHGLINEGMNNPELLSQLPMIPRTAARLSASERPFLRGVGEVLNETAAHAAQSRNLGGQIRNAGNFLFNPGKNAAYIPQIAAESPLAARLYGTLPSMFPIGGAATGRFMSSLGE